MIPFSHGWCCLPGSLYNNIISLKQTLLLLLYDGLMNRSDAVQRPDAENDLSDDLLRRATADRGASGVDRYRSVVSQNEDPVFRNLIWKVDIRFSVSFLLDIRFIYLLLVDIGNEIDAEGALEHMAECRIGQAV